MKTVSNKLILSIISLLLQICCKITIGKHGVYVNSNEQLLMELTSLSFGYCILILIVSCLLLSSIHFFMSSPYENRINWEFHKAFGQQAQDNLTILQYSDSIIPFDQNGDYDEDYINTKYSSDSNITNFILPSSPSGPDSLSKSSSMIINGSNNNILIRESRNSNNNYQINDWNKVNYICDKVYTKAIGYVITARDPSTTMMLSGLVNGYYIPISGNDYDNYIVGTNQKDVICARGGNDIVMAMGEDDIVYSGSGDDTVYGNDGSNQIFGQDGDDNIVGGQSNDLIVGGKGNDHIVGAFGDDILRGDQGADYFECSEGTDTVIDYYPSQGDVLSNNCDIVNNLDKPFTN